MIDAPPLDTLLADLAARGIRLHVQDGQLRCEAPRGALTDALKQQLTDHKPALLAKLAAPDAAPAPLSYAQQRLWLVAQADAASAAYHMRTALGITGLFDATALEAAIQAVVRRHAVLRTAFVPRDGSATQVVRAHVAVPLVRHDLRGAADAQARLDQIMVDAASQPFDLEHPPLLRAALVQRGPLDHVLLIVLHHLVSDGASLGILVAELGEHYTAALGQRQAQLPGLTVQYAELAAWQRGQLAPRLDQLRAYWLDELRGAPPYLELPTDRPRRATPSTGGATESFVLEPALADALRGFSRAHGVTLYTSLLTAFAVLLARTSGQAEVVIGAPVSLRTLPEHAPLIGMFVNTVVLRVRLDGDPTFAELVERVRRTTTGAYAHQDLPLEQVVELLAPERSPLHHPVFQVMFIHDDAPTPGALGGLTLEPLEYPAFDAKFDLTLSMSERGGGIHGRWEYRPALIDPATVRRTTAHLLAVLQAMALAPRQRALAASMLTPDERRQLLRDWNATAVEYPAAPGLPGLFADQVARTPAAVAVRSGADALTYAELAARAQQLARHLRGLGIGRGDRVAIALPRSPALLASLLGVLQAGAAYVPLDPGYPRARLAFMLADAAPAALISAGLDVDAPPGTRHLHLDAIAPGAGPDVACDAAPGDPAYLMYTSGSSGQPKAAIISHAALANYLRWCAVAYDVARGTGAVVSTSVAFDATVTSLFSPLLVGRAVVMLPEDGEIEALAAIVASGEPLGPLKLTPAHIDALRATAAAPRPGRVHAIVVGGEPLLGEHVAWCRAAAPDARVFNEYGPTETTVGCSIYEVPAGPPPPVIPIGRPIANARLYVLDAHRAPVPIGVTGELYVGGAGVGDGYHARPALTAERFVDDPFAAAPGARLYRTGDLAAYLPDGNLRFLGRRDDQIKLRGFRIELAEIEAVLAAHPAVGHAAVVVQPSAAGHPRLVGFVVVAGVPDLDALHRHLAEQLPEYMIPSAIVVVDALPLTPNGKVDRAALAAAPAPGAAPVAVATGEHAELVALWCEILGLPSVGITDNFFALGGDSILGIQLVARARARGIQLSPRQLVEHQTIEALARVVQRGTGAATDPGPVIGDVPLTPIQRAWFAEPQPEPHHWNQSVMLDVPADVDVPALEGALAALTAHHDALRARFDASDGVVTQRFAPPDAARALATIEVSGVPAGDAAVTARAAALQAALRLADGPVFAPTLLRCGPDAPARLLLTAHHLVVDGVSWRILLEDLLHAYAQARAGEPIRLPARTSSLRAWTERLARWASSPALAAQRAYWDRIDAAPSKPLAVDAPVAPGDDAHHVAVAAVVTRTLTAEATALLTGHVAAVYNAGVEHLLLAALARTFTDAGDHGVLVVDVESHGRAELFDDIDLSRTVGWLTSVFPIALALADGADPADTLLAVKEQLRGVPDLGVGYGVLRGSDAGARRAIRFNYFGQLDRAQLAPAGFALSTTPCGPLKSAASIRRNLIEIDAAIAGGVLSIEWTYSTRVFTRATIEALATRLVAELGVVARCWGDRDERRFTPSDFPDAALSQAELDGVLAEVAAAQVGAPR
jgi:amino acid adenylation domain-containing protein/non-ribosomal peptide synthase protein (TIGR01720 family)